MVVRELRVELPGEEHLDAEVRKRDEKAEQVYEELAAGETVEKAAAIAGELAQRMKDTEAKGGRLSQELEAIKNVEEKRKTDEPRGSTSCSSPASSVSSASSCRSSMSTRPRRGSAATRPHSSSSAASKASTR